MVYTNRQHMNINGDVIVYIHNDINQHDKIMRYMAFDRLKFLLNKGLYIPKIDSFLTGDNADPFEGEYTDIFYEVHKCIHNMNRNLTGDQIIKQEIKKTRSRVLASCWSLSDHENIALWRLYAGVKNSIAIETSVKQLKEDVENFVLCNNDNLMLKFLRKEIIKIKYIDHHDPEDINEAFYLKNFDMICRKNYGYEYEKEIRLVIDGSEPFREAIGDNLGKNIVVKIRPDKFINKILVSYRAEDDFFNKVKQYLQLYNLDRRVQWSKLKFVPGR